MSRLQMRNIVERTGIKFDPQQVLEEWEAIKHHMSRIGLMNACLPNEGIDRLKYFYIENPNVVPEIQGTIFEKFIRALPIKVSRGSFLNLIPNQCLRWHRDPDNKWHLHINDNPGTFFYDIEEAEAFPTHADGYVYRYNTAGRYHTAMNTSCFNRTHLVIAEYHCRESNPNKVWAQEVTVKIPKTMQYPPKISVGDSIEQAFMVKWNARTIHNGYVFSGAAHDTEDEEFINRHYTFEFINPDKLLEAFDGEFDMIQQSLKALGIDMVLGEIRDRIC
jgi:hypothetical protein